MSDIPVWPRFVFYAISLLSLPLYILVFICLLRLRQTSKIYKSTFHTIITQHGIADILSMVIYLATWHMRTVVGLREFYFDYQKYYTAAVSYNSIYYSLYIRCFGIILLTANRVLVITMPTKKWTMKIEKLPTVTICAVYWIVPTLISMVPLKDLDIHYADLESMEIIVDKDIINRNTVMAFIIVLSTFIFCTISYCIIFFSLKKLNLIFGSRRNNVSEIRLAFQVFAMVCVFFGMLVYFSFQNYFSRTHNNGPVFLMRELYALANGPLSYITPFCILILNVDFSRTFFKMYCCLAIRKKQNPVAYRMSTTIFTV